MARAIVASVRWTAVHGALFRQTELIYTAGGSMRRPADTSRALRSISYLSLSIYESDLSALSFLREYRAIRPGVNYTSWKTRGRARVISHVRPLRTSELDRPDRSLLLRSDYSRGGDTYSRIPLAAYPRRARTREIFRQSLGFSSDLARCSEDRGRSQKAIAQKERNRISPLKHVG